MAAVKKCPHCGKTKKGSDCPADSWEEDVKLAREAGQDGNFFAWFDEKMKQTFGDKIGDQPRKKKTP